ncbi:hypothetical protein [Porphyromonas gingivalis]|uniref:hypothetical protein n=1 Tax=Porphyromonas gingivalis TaxID=837 RepID=UPI0012FDC08A|nr:hypothetical protein [Porphyromonas gingivalis]
MAIMSVVSTSFFTSCNKEEIFEQYPSIGRTLSSQRAYIEKYIPEMLNINQEDLASFESKMEFQSENTLSSWNQSIIEKNFDRQKANEILLKIFSSGTLGESTSGLYLVTDKGEWVEVVKSRDEYVNVIYENKKNQFWVSGCQASNGDVCVLKVKKGFVIIK